MSIYLLQAQKYDHKCYTYMKYYLKGDFGLFLFVFDKNKSVINIYHYDRIL